MKKLILWGIVATVITVGVFYIVFQTQQTRIAFIISVVVATALAAVTIKVDTAVIAFVAAMAAVAVAAAVAVFIYAPTAVMFTFSFTFSAAAMFMVVIMIAIANKQLLKTKILFSLLGEIITISTAIVTILNYSQ